MDINQQRQPVNAKRLRLLIWVRSLLLRGINKRSSNDRRHRQSMRNIDSSRLRPLLKTPFKSTTGARAIEHITRSALAAV